MKTKILVSVVAVFFIIVGNAFAVPFYYEGSPKDDVDTYNGVLLYLNVTDTGTISDLNVSLVVSDPYVDDLYIRLYHVGTMGTKFNYLYLGGRNDISESFIDANFDDQASSNYPTGAV